jgi:hypothetical protein
MYRCLTSVPADSTLFSRRPRFIEEVVTLHMQLYLKRSTEPPLIYCRVILFMFNVSKVREQALLKFHSHSVLKHPLAGLGGAIRVFISTNLIFTRY